VIGKLGDVGCDLVEEYSASPPMRHQPIEMPARLLRNARRRAGKAPADMCMTEPPVCMAAVCSASAWVPPRPIRQNAGGTSAAPDPAGLRQLPFEAPAKGK
jgi:hypothetical protein